MPTHSVETLPGGTRVWTDAQHRFGTDALLLAEFCAPRPAWRICDLGTGCGILLLAFADAGHRGPATGLDIDPAGTALLAGAATENGFSHIEPLCCDLRAYRPVYKTDLVVANPPYFSAGPASPTPERAGARHQIHATLDDVCIAAARTLKEKGRFCLCYPAEHLATLAAALCARRLAPKRLQLVRTAPDAQPWLALVEARLGGGEGGLRIGPDRILPPSHPLHY